MIALTGYQIGAQIYESANSLVYRAIREVDNQAVILKVLKQDYPTPAELTRYRRSIAPCSRTPVTGDRLMSSGPGNRRSPSEWECHPMARARR
ncbi:MAG: hypothetical protein AB4352_02310 [Hormoscilla sp.]